MMYIIHSHSPHREKNSFLDIIVCVQMLGSHCDDCEQNYEAIRGKGETPGRLRMTAIGGWILS